MFPRRPPGNSHCNTRICLTEPLDLRLGNRIRAYLYIHAMKVFRLFQRIGYVCIQYKYSIINVIIINKQAIHAYKSTKESSTPNSQARSKTTNHAHNGNTT